MKQMFLSLLFWATAQLSFGQSSFTAIIKDSASREPLPGATAVLKGTTTGATADAGGRVELIGLAAGRYTVVFSLMGYAKRELDFDLPMGAEVEVYLQPEAGEMDEIIVEGTRSNKSIADIPTRVEVLTDEIDEAATMDPSKVAHLLSHSTGIQVQQTSATSNTANVRIQGLDGRYTQILKDGFPLYGGFSNSLSIMQIPPLDLRQVEFIKGSASTLYGGGAISGLINLISKEPDAEETLLHLNASQVGAMDVNAFVSRKRGKTGFTLLGQRNTHRYFDADRDGFSDLPRLTKYNLNPRVFFELSEKTKLVIGATLTDETRQGGDTHLMNFMYPDSLHFYKEVNHASRVTTQLKLEHRWMDKHRLTLRNSFNFFQRELAIVSSPQLDEYRFAGRQLSTFSEAAYTFSQGAHLLIAGINYYSDVFREDSLQSPMLRDEKHLTTGGFVNYNVDLSERAAVEAGLRIDQVQGGRSFVLPRLAMLFRWSQKLTSRLGGGLGYRNATLFNQEAEMLGYRQVLPLGHHNPQAEQSYGGNADVGFRTALGSRFFISINQMFFYTYLRRPLVLLAADNGFAYANANGYTQSLGTETYFKFGFYDFVWFVGYTFTNATNHFNRFESAVPLTPRHSVKSDLMYVMPGRWRLGADFEYKSRQQLSDGRTTRAYWTSGVLIEYTTGKFTLFGNVENYTDVRQTRFESMRTEPYATPQFTEVWAPLDGIVVNGGMKLRL